MSKSSVNPDIGVTPWFKSSYSQPSESACVEIRFAADQVGVRDSKAPDEGRLAFHGSTWSQFTAWVTE